MSLQELKPRTQAILRLVIDRFVRDGQPVGSATLSRDMAALLGLELSPASVRNTLAELEEAGLLYAAHISGGRMPTEAGLSLFVNDLLEVQPLDDTAKTLLNQDADDAAGNTAQRLDRVGRTLSSLSACTGLVAAPKKDKPFRQMEFVRLSERAVLAVWVGVDGSVENRVIDMDAAPLPHDLKRASDYLNTHLHGRTLADAKKRIATDLNAQRAAIDTLTHDLVQRGLASFGGGADGVVIVRGQSNLLSDVREVAELDRLRRLFDTLEQHEIMLRLVEETATANGVRIFIGAQNPLFNHAGCSLIVAPYKDKHQNVIGAIGVIGPSRLNYGRIIPMVDYTAKILSGV